MLIFLAFPFMFVFFLLAEPVGWLFDNILDWLHVR